MPCLPLLLRAVVVAILTLPVALGIRDRAVRQREDALARVGQTPELATRRWEAIRARQRRSGVALARRPAPQG